MDTQSTDGRSSQHSFSPWDPLPHAPLLQTTYIQPELDQEEYDMYGAEEEELVADAMTEKGDGGGMVVIKGEFKEELGRDDGMGVAGSSSRSRTGSNELDLELQSLLDSGYSMSRLQAVAVLPLDLPPFEPICPQTTLSACLNRGQCPFPHFSPIIRPWTDPTLGFCSYLNLCYGDPLFSKNPSLSSGQGGGPGASGGTKHCRYQHFRLVPPAMNAPPIPGYGVLPVLSPKLRKFLNGRSKLAGTEIDIHDEAGDEEIRDNSTQWLNMDARSMTPSILGSFPLILADPPWDIHMSLPYGTLSDDDCRSLTIPQLQPTWGLLAMWVTGRAMELARELFKLWGYRRVEEIVWVKVGQLGGLVKTGRTGHWLNHTCEHLLLALKLPPLSEFPNPDADIPYSTDPRLDYLRRGVDGDVVVSEVRETSRKPEEFYGILERMVPRGRKLEVFGRKHNTRPGWLTIGNQLDDNHILEKGLLSRLQLNDPNFTNTATTT